MNTNELTVGALLDLSHTIAAELFQDKEYPWEALPDIAGFDRSSSARAPRYATVPLSAAAP